MSRSRVRLNAFALLATSALLLASLGCNPGSLTAPDSASLNVAVTNPDFVRILPSSSKTPADGPVAAPFVSRVVSARDGGTVSNGRITLEFPPGALSEDTEITIRMADDGTLGAEFGPHGIQFNRPVVMSTDLRGTTAEGSASTVTTLWEDTEHGQFVPMPSLAPTDANTSRCELRHFSNYDLING